MFLPSFFYSRAFSFLPPFLPRFEVITGTGGLILRFHTRKDNLSEVRVIVVVVVFLDFLVFFFVVQGVIT